MRVLIVNTSEKAGGAAVAANRLMDALNNNGVKAKMLVRDKVTDDITVVGLPTLAQDAVEFPVGALVHLLPPSFFQEESLCTRYRQCGIRHHFPAGVQGG